MIPTWRALPLWMKILLLPLLVSSVVAIAAGTIWVLAGIGLGIRAVVLHLVDPIRSAWKAIVRKFRGRRIDLIAPSDSGIRVQEGA